MGRISKLKDEEYYIDFDQKSIFHGSDEVARFTEKQSEILEYFAVNHGIWRSYANITDNCWDGYVSPDTVSSTFSRVRNKIHEKVGESFEKRDNDWCYRYLGGPITDEDVRLIDSGATVVTDKEDELLFRVAKYKIHKHYGREIDEVLHQDLEIIVASIISGVTEATWKEYSFNKKLQEVRDTYDALQLTYEDELTLSL